MTECVSLGGHEVVLDASGLLYLPDERIIVVADLHLEKGSAFARRGTMLPPYDTQATLDRLRAVLARFAPRRVVSLGDGFHDNAGARLITGHTADLLHELAAVYDWLWLKGNHDHELPVLLPGTIQDELHLRELRLRHQPADEEKVQICGHFHPKARVKGRRRTMTRPCFAWRQELMIMPAFGEFTGGLNLLEPALQAILPQPQIVLLGTGRTFPVHARHLIPEPGSINRQRELA